MSLGSVCACGHAFVPNRIPRGGGESIPLEEGGGGILSKKRIKKKSGAPGCGRIFVPWGDEEDSPEGSRGGAESTPLEEEGVACSSSA